MQRMDHPRLAELYAIEDPYSYRDRLTMPKFIVNSAGDEFFLPDSSQFYFDDLKGEKYLRYVPNSNHSLKDTDAVESIIAFYRPCSPARRGRSSGGRSKRTARSACSRKRSPRRSCSGRRRTPTRRDFRLAVIGKAYKSQSLVDQGTSTFIANLERAAQGLDGIVRRADV